VFAGRRAKAHGAHDDPDGQARVPANWVPLLNLSGRAVDLWSAELHALRHGALEPCSYSLARSVSYDASTLRTPTYLVTADRMHAGNAVLDAVNVEAALGQFDLLPLQVAHLRGPQTVPIGDQDHGRIPMPIAAMLAGAVHQPVDLALGEIAPLDCQVYDAWGAFLGCRFHRGKTFLLDVE